MTLAEAGANCHSFMCDYVSTQFDPAHLLSELGFTLVFDLILIPIAVLVYRKLVARITKRIHAEIDAEHHVAHHEHTDNESREVYDSWAHVMETHEYDGDGVLRKKLHANTNAYH